MRSLILVTIALLGLSVTAFGKKPLFHYHDKVRVTEGFYTSCIGIIEEFHTNFDDTKIEYTVHSFCKGGDLSFDVSESSIEIVIFED